MVENKRVELFKEISRLEELFRKNYQGNYILRHPQFGRAFAPEKMEVHQVTERQSIFGPSTVEILVARICLECREIKSVQNYYTQASALAAAYEEAGGLKLTVTKIPHLE